jgi:hypothetical protein
MSRAIYVLTQEQVLDVFNRAQEFSDDYSRRSYSANCSQCEAGKHGHDNMHRVAPFGRDGFGCALTREAWKLKTMETLLARYEFVSKGGAQ